MLAIMAWNDCEQMELFPEATKDEIKAAKSLLSRYRRMKLMVEDFERTGIEGLAPKQKAVYNAYKLRVQSIDRAVNLILDPEIKRVLEKRFIKGESHKVTVLHFGSSMHPSTVDRKINKGIELVANTLKLWEA